jgi:glycosyltransferase involved in cell wall biosynthesis
MHHVTNGQQDYAAGQPLPTQSRRNRFGFFGQMVDNKGVWVLLRAVALLRSEGFTDFAVELNGDNRQYASEDRRAEIDNFLAAEQALPFDQQIVFANGVYHIDQLADRMARIDWCVVPSVWPEAFGLVISEAGMFKRPVICSNLGAMAERVVDGCNGLNFALATPRSLADVIRRAATEDGLWETLSSGIQAPPTRDEMVEGYLQIYGEESPKWITGSEVMA